MTDRIEKTKYVSRTLLDKADHPAQDLDKTATVKTPRPVTIRKTQYRQVIHLRKKSGIRKPEPVSSARTEATLNDNVGNTNSGNRRMPSAGNRATNRLRIKHKVQQRDFGKACTRPEYLPHRKTDNLPAFSNPNRNRKNKDICFDRYRGISHYNFSIFLK